MRRLLAPWTSSTCARRRPWHETALRPERFGALAYDFDTRRLSFVRRALAGARLAQRRVRARPGRADLPDLGAHLRVQPRVRALPVVLGAARPARALDRRVHGGDRRARADAGLLREHRRRRADGPQGLLGVRGVRDRAPRRREVLHQRESRIDAGARGVDARQRLRRRADLARRRDRRGQRPRARRRVLRDRAAAMELLAGTGFKLSVVVTRENASQLDEFKAIADRYGATLRLTRLRPSGRGADVWDELHPTAGAAAGRLRLAARARRVGADRRLVLPPRRVRRRRCRG